MSVQLCPAQRQGFDELRRLLPLGNVFVLSGGTGSGRTTLLRELHREGGGAFLNMKDFLEAVRQRNPVALEETFEQLVLDALQAHDTVIVDDLRLLSNVASNHFYPRMHLLDAPLTTLTTYAAEAGKKLVFGIQNDPSDPIRERCHFARIRDFDADDYAFLCRQYLDARRAEQLDYRKIKRSPTRSRRRASGWRARTTNSRPSGSSTTCARCGCSATWTWRKSRRWTCTTCTAWTR